ncbi:MAG: NAD(P)-dependent oxidoreductase [Deltaproteobacteria bacterium]|nr:NAD(P)-dependent oxidoreductase [Deltaproteobacteria bacterium]MBW1983933.1 NAD(P)-dependent oxidoreductase [Deltaproteobacteria bacterium]
MSQENRGLVLITGAAGFTGHHMVAEAVKAGFRVRATDISSRHYGAMFDALGVEFVASNLTKREGLDSLVHGVDGVIHVAGIHDYSTPDKVIFAVNVGGVKNICDAAEKAGVSRFVHFSSVGVYGYSSNPGHPVKEDDPKVTPPLNNYNLSKWEGEQILQGYMKENRLRTTIFRPAAIYGTRSEYGLYNAFEQIYNDRKKKKMLMVGKGDKIEAFLHVEDMCRAVIFAYDNDSTIGEIYNISDDTHITSAEFFKLICRELTGKEKPFMNVPLSILAPVARISQFIAKLLGTKSLLEKATLDYMSCDKIWDNSKLKSAGFTFKYPTIENGMKETLKWYMDNGWFKS